MEELKFFSEVTLNHPLTQLDPFFKIFVSPPLFSVPASFKVF